MQKVSRLLAIERIIEKESISSQEELMNKLRGEGIKCTQATLSRNLRQLGAIRVPDSRGGYRYSLRGRNEPGSDRLPGFSIISVIRVMIDTHSMVVMKTLPGHANSVAVVIDNAGRFEIAGTVAGDDTLLIIPREDVSRDNIHDCLEIIFPGLHKKVRKE